MDAGLERRSSAHVEPAEDPAVSGPGTASGRPDGAGLVEDPAVSGPGTASGPPDGAGLVDWARLARRLRVTVLALAAMATALWAAVGLLGDGLRLGDLWGYLGLSLGALFVAEIVIVGGAAVRGLLRAGARGERLAGGDVGLLPPQLHRRR